MDAEETIFQLGQFLFRLQSADHEFTKSIARMLPIAMQDAQAGSPITTIDLDVPYETPDKQILGFPKDGLDIAIACIVDQALKSHTEAIWMEGSALIDNQGRLILLAGVSHSGKSTLTLASNLLNDWGVASEDITLVDVQTNCIIPFSKPFSLRPGTLDRLRRATSKTPNSFNVCLDWYFRDAIYNKEQLGFAPAVAVLLTPIQINAPGNFSVDNISPAEFARHIMSMSNALRLPEALQRFTGSFNNAECYRLSGGELEERLQWLTEKADQK